MALIYSRLHQNIQDSFNKANVEILSPHYKVNRFEEDDLALIEGRKKDKKKEVAKPDDKKADSSEE